MSATSKVMSGVDSAWLHMEEPTNLMMVTGVALLDAMPDMARLRQVLRERLLVLDRFTMRVVEGSLPIGMPRWEADPTFDLDNHIHRIALPEPGDEHELRVLISDLASTPLDFSKPLWQIHMVDNVLDGAAMILRFHHCVGDGTSMKFVMSQLMETAQGHGMPEVAAPPRGEQRRGLIGTLMSPVRGALGFSRKTAGFLMDEGMESILHPARLLERAEQATDSAAVVARMLRLPADPETPFKGELGVQKRVAWSAPLPLPDAKFIAHCYGTKINDVLMSIMSGALRAYLLDQGVDPSGMEIHAVVPVDLRPPQRAYELGNNFGLVFLGLPLGYGDPVARLFEVSGRMNDIKRSPEAVVFFSLLSLFGHTPVTVEEQVVNLFGARATTVLTNVAGPRETLYLAGSRIEHMLFWVPQSGRLGMGISILSYDGEVLIGLITDAGLVPNPTAITDHVNREFADLLALAESEAS